MICNNLCGCYQGQQNLCTQPSVCKTISSGDSIVCKEKNREYELSELNGISVLRYHVDGGIFTDSNDGKRCDYLLVAEISKQERKFVFLELKGTDYGQGVNQLLETVNILRPQISSEKLYARIVCSGVTHFENNPVEIKLKNKVMNFKRVSKRRFSERLSDLVP